MTSFYGPGADQIGLSAVKVKDPDIVVFPEADPDPEPALKNL